MLTISRENAMEILKPIFSELGNCINLAGADYEALDHAQKVRYCASTRACIIRDNMIFRAKERLGHLPDVRFVEKGLHVFMVVADQLCIKFKKLNKHLRAGFIPTQEALRFYNQGASQLSLFSDIIKPLTNLVAGYQWDNMLATMKGAFLVCPSGPNNDWWVEMSLTKAEVTRMAQAKPTKSTKRVTAKAPKKALTGEESNA